MGTEVARSGNIALNTADPPCGPLGAEVLSTARRILAPTARLRGHSQGKPLVSQYLQFRTWTRTSSKGERTLAAIRRRASRSWGCTSTSASRR